LDDGRINEFVFRVESVSQTSDLFMGIHTGSDYNSSLKKAGCYTLSYHGGNGYFDASSNG